jgi:hypothetical protein
MRVPAVGAPASGQKHPHSPDADALRAEARRLMEQAGTPADFTVARDVLLRALALDPLDREGKTRHLLGLASFHLQDWAEAERHLVASLWSAKNPMASALLERAQTNRKTGIERAVDPLPDLRPDELRRPPACAIRAPETSAEEPPLQRRGSSVVRLAHAVFSRTLGLLTEGAVRVVYALRKRSPTFAFESWDRLCTPLGLLELGGRRRDLNGDKLQSTYGGSLVGHQQPGQRRPPWTERFRTATGAWTTDDPMEGAAGTEIQRSGSPLKDRESRLHDPGLPSPREVSRLILAPHANRPRQEVPFLNLLTIAWIQAQVHDWASHRPSPVPGTEKLGLGADDPLRSRYGIGTLHVPLSPPNPTRDARPLTYLNEVTHWWDASHIYGSDQDTQDRLRCGPDGELRIESDLLPLNRATDIEDTGFTRNWWIGLDLMHTLFVKHHNSICRQLRQEHKHWTSDEVFHTARLINAAIMAKIQTVEWTPAVLPNSKVVTGMATNWWGLIETWRRPFHRRRLNRRWEPRHHVLGGIAAGARENYGKPYGLTEEFAEVYRLHAGMPDEIRMPGQVIPTDATRGTAARAMVREFGMATLLNSFGHQHMPALVNNNYPAFMCEMSVPGQPVIDIGTIDILRARERGVPPYNAFRRMLGLKPIERFDDLGCSAETVQALEKLYGKGEKGVNSLDLLAGTSCELWRPENFGFGETLFTIFIQMASRRLHADPFYTAKFNSRYYTEAGMALIEKATFKSVLLEHYPQLARAGLDNVENAFEPWGTSAKERPEEHPLARIETY